MTKIIVTFLGYKTKILKPVFNFEMIINMVRDTVKLLNENITTPPPPSAPSAPGINIRGDGLSPIYVVDGIIMTKAEAEKIDPNEIESINVRKSKSTTDKYGEKGKDGVVEIITKKDVVNVVESVSPVKEMPALQEISPAPSADTLEFKNDSIVIVEETPNQTADKNPFVVGEEMPSFPGGSGAMQAWLIISNILQQL